MVEAGRRRGGTKEAVRHEGVDVDEDGDEDGDVDEDEDVDGDGDVDEDEERLASHGDEEARLALGAQRVREGRCATCDLEPPGGDRGPGCCEACFKARACGREIGQVACATCPAEHNNEGQSEEDK